MTQQLDLHAIQDVHDGNPVMYRWLYLVHEQGTQMPTTNEIADYLRELWGASKIDGDLTISNFYEVDGREFLPLALSFNTSDDDFESFIAASVPYLSYDLVESGKVVFDPIRHNSFVNEGTPDEYDQLAEGKEEALRIAEFRNDGDDAPLYNELKKLNGGLLPIGARAAAIHDDGTPPRLLATLLAPTTHGTRQLWELVPLLDNPRTPVSAVLKFLEDVDVGEYEFDYYNVVEECANLPTRAITYIYNNTEDYFAVAWIAGHKNTSKVLLRELEDSDDGDIRWQLAANANISSAAIKRLFNDEEARGGLFRNEKVSLDLLEQLYSGGTDVPEDATRWVAHKKQRIETYRTEQKLEGVPDSFIEQALWGRTE